MSFEILLLEASFKGQSEPTAQETFAKGITAGLGLVENISAGTGKVPVQYCLACSSLQSLPKDHYGHSSYMEKLQSPKEQAEVRFFLSG